MCSYFKLSFADQDATPEDKMMFLSPDNVKQDETHKDQQHKKNNLQQKRVGERKENCAQL